MNGNAHVGEVGMAKAADAEILKWAVQQRGAIIVTLDADFHHVGGLSSMKAVGDSITNRRAPRPG
jgi:predicted nuclease of predicted toxin-antitoxin system